jgi:hypothetical protein
MVQTLFHLLPNLSPASTIRDTKICAHGPPSIDSTIPMQNQAMKCSPKLANSLDARLLKQKRNRRVNKAAHLNKEY